MTFTDEQLANAAKALGVEWIMYPCLSETLLEDIGISRKKRTLAFGPGFAEWAIPILEERHPLWFSISYADKWVIDAERSCKNGFVFQVSGPDIDTATLLLSSKIGEGLE